MTPEEIDVLVACKETDALISKILGIIHETPDGNCSECGSTPCIATDDDVDPELNIWLWCPKCKKEIKCRPLGYSTNWLNAMNAAEAVGLLKRWALIQNEDGFVLVQDANQVRNYKYVYGETGPLAVCKAIIFDYEMGKGE